MEHTHHEPPQPPHAHSKKRDDLAIPVAIVIAGAFIALAIFFSGNTDPARAGVQNVAPQNNETSDILAELALRTDDHVYGNPNADVLIIEYSDTECPFCKQFHKTMESFMSEQGNAGNVAWVYRHFPLDQIHPRARKEAEALECATELGGNETFWRYASKLFDVTPANNGLDPSVLPVIAAEVGLDISAFNACLSSGKFADRVDSDFVSGVTAGVKGTPHSFVWNRRTGEYRPMNGALPIQNIKSVLKSVQSAPAQ